jgi:glyoxylase-like metal-dependent hydrolase (beta-lactamase superfamily II)
MSKLARREFLKLAGISSAAAGATLVPGMNSRANTRQQTGGLLGTVVQVRRGPLTLHTYVAPDASAAVTTHIIETANSLVVVDTQFLQTFSRDARAYIDSLSKPIERVILSHEHPDHWMGANNFADAPFYATEATMTNTNTAIDSGTVANLAGILGESEVPDEPNAPTEVLSTDAETIDGVAFEYTIYANHESAESLVIRLPEANTLIVQDLLYNNVHFFPGMDRDNWLTVLQTLRAEAEGDLLLVGHGLPTSFGELDLGIEYLTFVQETIPTVENADELIAALQERYPSFASQDLILGFWQQFFPTS